MWPDHDDVWSSARAAGSLLYAIDTALGPIYLGAGLTEGGESSLFLSIGRTFGGGLGR